MKNIYPYIFTSEHTLVNQAYSFDNQSGVTYRAIEGVHAIWAARVPFLPLMRSDDLIRVGNSRISLIQQRQFRFIYDLARIRENQSTFVLRFISTPNPVIGQPNLIDIIFLAKSFSKTPANALKYAEELWERFSSIFPTEDPFGYPLDPVTSEEEFFQYYEPIPFDSLRSENLLEIRKYEDMPIRSTAPTARVERKGDYIAHPFVPSQNSNPMSRFFMALASQPEKCFVDISLRPTKMFDQEIYNVSFMVGQFKKTASEDVVAQREESLAKQLAEMKKRKKKLVDPLQFEMSIQAEDLSSYVPSFGWEMGPPSDKQKQTLEKLGIMPDQIENAGKAAKILDRLDKRRNEGLTTPKQIRFLEGRGFKHVGTWQFNTAKNLIDRIAGNGWKIPNDIVPQEYKGA